MLNKNNFRGLTISSELSSDEIKDLLRKSHRYNTSLELIVQGNQEIMVSKDDFSNLSNGNLDINPGEYVVLEDKEHKAKYHIHFDYNKQSHFFNDECLCLIDEVGELKQMGINNITIDGRFTKEKYLTKIISLYIQKLRKPDTQTNLYENIDKLSLSTLNKGNYEKGRVLEDLKNIRKRKKLRQH